jgi:hypothetical protein
MRRWKPQPSGLLWVAVAATAAAAAGAGYLLLQIGAALIGPPADWPIDSALFAQFLACVALLFLAGALIYRVAATLTLAYAIDRNGLYISWLGNRAVVPLQQIESVESGISAPTRLSDQLRSVGYYHGRVRSPDGRTVHRFTTLPLSRAMVLHTSADSYAISPQDAESFVQDLEQRRRLGAVQQLAPGVETGQAFFYAFWDDTLVRRSLFIAALLNLALLGGLMTLYPGLPALVDLRADAAGMATALVPRHQILFLPLAGAAVGLLNVGLGLTFYRREPLGARLLQVASVIVQGLFIVAALSILR